jgi:hypothetical protein
METKLNREAVSASKVPWNKGKMIGSKRDVGHQVL